MSDLFFRIVAKCVRLFVKVEHKLKLQGRPPAFSATRIDGEHYRRRKTPVAPWAFIRVKNEIITIDASLKSMLPAIKKGVIGVCPSDDGTREYVCAFCEKHKGFKMIDYPHEVYPPSSPAYHKCNPHDPRQLDHFYNAVLAHIPRGAWMIKIDADHIYDSEKLARTFYLPRHDWECIIYPRLHLHYEAGKLYADKHKFWVAHEDHWLIKNIGLRFKMKTGKQIGKDGKTRFFAWERLALDRYYTYAPVLNWHFPLIKKSRNMTMAELVEFREMLQITPPPDKNSIPLDMFDEARIRHVCEGFNWKEKRILP